jgi:hypothetical protein
MEFAKARRVQRGAGDQIVTAETNHTASPALERDFNGRKGDA